MIPLGGPLICGACRTLYHDPTPSCPDPFVCLTPGDCPDPRCS